MTQGGEKDKQNKTTNKTFHTKMKKLALTLAIVLGLGLSSFAEGNQGGGLFRRGAADEASYGIGGNRDINTPMLPAHNQSTNQNAPLGSGALLLLGFGAAYALKKRKENK